MLGRRIWSIPGPFHTPPVYDQKESVGFVVRVGHLDLDGGTDAWTATLDINDNYLIVDNTTQDATAADTYADINNQSSRPLTAATGSVRAASSPAPRRSTSQKRTIGSP